MAYIPVPSRLTNS